MKSSENESAMVRLKIESRFNYVSATSESVSLNAALQIVNKEIFRPFSWESPSVGFKKSSR